MSRRVTIGMPTYNRADLLQEAVESLQSQTHRDIEILISDNASPDSRVEVLLKDLAKHDARIKYVRRPSNDGPAVNFRSVLNDVTTPYFMWASDDDVWDPHFVERCLELLESNPRAQMACATIDNTNLCGVALRAYSGFSRCTSSSDLRADALRFIAEPDILGKSNLIYGLYRTATLKAVVEQCWNEAGFDKWGGDVVLVFAFITRHPIVAMDDVLLHKRVRTVSAAPLSIREPETYLIPPQHYMSFVRRHEAVASDLAIRSDIARAFRQRTVKQALISVRHLDFWIDNLLATGRHIFRFVTSRFRV